MTATARVWEKMKPFIKDVWVTVYIATCEKDALRAEAGLDYMGFKVDSIRFASPDESAVAVACAREEGVLIDHNPGETLYMIDGHGKMLYTSDGILSLRDSLTRLLPRCSIVVSADDGTAPPEIHRTTAGKIMGHKTAAEVKASYAMKRTRT